MGFWNVREYVLSRDGHTCQCCRGKSKDPILNVHHIESRKVGGNAPNNLVTLCETCHKGYHNGTVKLPKTIKRGASFKDAAFMGIMRWKLMDALREKYGDAVSHTYGYITKKTRIDNGLPKDHTIDARCISGNPNALVCKKPYIVRKVRCHNRQLHKAKIMRGDVRKANQAPKEVFGFRLWDSVKYEKQLCFVKARRLQGNFILIVLCGYSIPGSPNYKNLKLKCHNQSYLFGV